MEEAEMRSRLLFVWRKVTYVALCRLALLFYVLIPFILKFIPSIFLQSVFSSKYKGPAVYSKLTNPDKDWGFEGSSNQYVPSSSGNTLGVWHLPPKSAVTNSLEKADKVVLYCHGKAGNRATGHRIGFYDVLRDLGFHVVTFDYSGFGDSTGSPDGRVVTQDTISVYVWIVRQVQRSDAIILVWGHSLGSGIASVALAEMSRHSLVPLPHGVVLESTFTNLYDASKRSTMFRMLDVLYPYVFRKIFKSSARNGGMELDLEKHLLEVKSNILILHSEDDPKISVELAQKLYDSVTSNLGTKVVTVKLYRIGTQYSLGHNLVYTFKHLKEILNNFTEGLHRDSYVSGKIRFEQISI